MLFGIKDVKNIKCSKRIGKLFGEDEKFLLVPNDTKILFGFKDIIWYHR